MKFPTRTGTVLSAVAVTAAVTFATTPGAAMAATAQATSPTSQPAPAATGSAGAGGATPLDKAGEYSYFCDYGTGQTPWLTPSSCQGTLYTYISGQYVGSVNVLAVQAAFPPRTDIPRTVAKLDKWCSDHSFQCAMAVGSGFFLLSLLKGGADS